MRGRCLEPGCDEIQYKGAVLRPGACRFHEALAAMLLIEAGRFDPEKIEDRARIGQLQGIIRGWLRAFRASVRRGQP